MAQLSEIIGSILRDMVAAQHEANMYALRLAAAYRAQGEATNFPPPSVSLGEAELVLKYGIKGDPAKTERQETDPAAAKRALAKLAAELSKAAVVSFVATVQTEQAAETRADALPAEAHRIIGRLGNDQPLRRDFAAFVGHRLAGALQTELPQFLDGNGGFDASALMVRTLELCRRIILGNKDLESLFSDSRGTELRTAITERLETDLQGLLPQLLAKTRITRLKTVSALDVTVAAADLAELPEECIHTLHFKISARDLPPAAEND